jgi:transposase
MFKVTRVGVDLAKSVIQVHAVDAKAEKIVNRALKRDKFLSWCLRAPQAATIGAANWGLWDWCLSWSRHNLAAPFRKAGKHGKNDANDAKAVCEAAGRPVGYKKIAETNVKEP